MRSALALTLTSVVLGWPAGSIVPVPRGAPVGTVLLVGPEVMWARDDPVPSLYVGRRRIWTAPRVSLPADYPTQTGFDYFVGQGVAPISRMRVGIVFLRVVYVVRRHVCHRGGRFCGPPDDTFPLYSEVWRGPLRGPFRRVAGGPGRPRVTAAAASGDDVVFAERVQPDHSRIVLQRSGRRTVLADGPSRAFPQLALSGRYAAWLDWKVDDRGDYADSFRLVVYDVAARRTAYALEAAALRSNNPPGFDVDARGTVVFTAERSPEGGCDGGLAWASTREPRAHFIRSNALSGTLRIAGGRIAYVTRASCTGARARLALIDLRGRMQRLTPPLLSSGPFDYDGRRLAYADARRDDTVLRVVDVGKP